MSGRRKIGRLGAGEGSGEDAFTALRLGDAMERSVRDTFAAADLAGRVHCQAGQMRRRRRQRVLGSVALLAIVGWAGAARPWLQPARPGEASGVTVVSDPGSSATPSPSANLTPSATGSPSGTGLPSGTGSPSSRSAGRSAAGTLTSPSRPSAGTTWGAVTYEDGFAGATVDGRWTVYTDGQPTPVSLFSPDRVRLGSGTVRIGADRPGTSAADPARATVGGIGALGSLDRYGRWDVRWRMGASPGAVGQFVLGTRAASVFVVTLMPDDGRLQVENRISGQTLQQPVNGTVYHTVTLEWSPSGARWLLDGRQFGVWTTGLPTAALWPALQTLVLVDCTPSPLPAGCSRPAALPQNLEVDSLRYWALPS